MLQVKSLKPCRSWHWRAKRIHHRSGSWSPYRCSAEIVQSIHSQVNVFLPPVAHYSYEILYLSEKHQKHQEFYCSLHKIPWNDWLFLEKKKVEKKGNNSFFSIFILWLNKQNFWEHVVCTYSWLGPWGCIHILMTACHIDQDKNGALSHTW